MLHDTEVERRLQKCSLKGKGLLLSHCNLSAVSIPRKVWNLTDLVRLDLGFNNLSYLDPRIGRLRNLRQLYVNDNPLETLPVELSTTSDLRVLDCHNTRLQSLPREFARLRVLTDVNLEGCPLKESIRVAYAGGVLSLFRYLQRKDERQTLKGELLRLLKEDIYPFTPRESLERAARAVFEELKDFNSRELKKLLKNAGRIFPKQVEDLNPQEARTSLRQYVEEEEERNSMGRLTLELRACFPEEPLDSVGAMAAELHKALPEESDRREVLALRSKLLPKDVKQFDGTKVRADLETLRGERTQRKIAVAVRNLYRDAENAKVENLSGRLAAAILQEIKGNNNNGIVKAVTLEGLGASSSTGSKGKGGTVKIPSSTLRLLQGALPQLLPADIDSALEIEPENLLVPKTKETEGEGEEKEREGDEATQAVTAPA
uniref:Uncharacterized protein n=1 Tax=Chromera velia CCMP2878 TaxID=1169474 RepID=A0A0G4HCY7_9ALVE|eukprot:Cvel_26196.t1-p1 / transcript=Cvel_26196.t1 / gene=Cvel_26196 / organism=Chromera_velia_CCMP2878 / gene_product=CCR4-NOT transcription complex subunit 6-like-B, putative / transcript_product=CCR4-NOT transcription complex subunit 6-like-B, putative / location=Cvel_scaffold3082:6486-10313(+) / protein_length=431 / sequence_SO=supercontig / SO=protein_coding / is_pseudo=false